MRAAIAVLAGTQVQDGGRRIAVLGDMLELGETAPQLHAALARDLESSDIDLVYCAGLHMHELDAALPAKMRGAYATESRDLITALQSSIAPGDVVMVKGSLGSRMAVIVDALSAMNTSTVACREVTHAV